MASDAFLQAFAPFLQGAASPSPVAMPEDDILSRIVGAQGPDTSNVLGQLLNPQNGPQSAPSIPADQMPRPRKSVLDIIGGVSDVLAKVGGAEALYQPTLDARQDRSRDIDLDGLRKALLQNQVASGQQNLKAGDVDIRTGEVGLENDTRTKIGQALGGLVGQENPAELWGQIAQTAGIPPDKAAAIGAALQQNPDMIGPLAASFGYTAPKTGSLPKEAQIYQMLAGSDDPELANAYLKKLADPNAEMTPYQAAQVGIAEKRLGFDQFKFANPQPTAGERTAATKADAARETQVKAAQSAAPIISDLKDAFARLKKAGSINFAGQTGEQRVGAAAYESVPGLERITNPQGYSARQDINRLTTQGIMSLLPLLGGITLGGKNIDAAKELETWRATIATAKDYDSAMRSIAGFEKRIKEITSAPQASAAAPAGGGREVKGGIVDPAALAEARRRGLIK